MRVKNKALHAVWINNALFSRTKPRRGKLVPEIVSPSLRVKRILFPPGTLAISVAFGGVDVDTPHAVKKNTRVSLSSPVKRSRNVSPSLLHPRLPPSHPFLSSSFPLRRSSPPAASTPPPRRQPEKISSSFSILHTPAFQPPSTPTPSMTMLLHGGPPSFSSVLYPPHNPGIYLLHFALGPTAPRIATPDQRRQTARKTFECLQARLYACLFSRSLFSFLSTPTRWLETRDFLTVGGAT